MFFGVDLRFSITVYEGMKLGGVVNIACEIQHTVVQLFRLYLSERVLRRLHPSIFFYESRGQLHFSAINNNNNKEK
jgi:hypothetical protein